jgi:hypothetical protein
LAPHHILQSRAPRRCKPIGEARQFVGERGDTRIGGGLARLPPVPAVQQQFKGVVAGEGAAGIAGRATAPYVAQPGIPNLRGDDVRETVNFRY